MVQRRVVDLPIVPLYLRDSTMPCLTSDMRSETAGQQRAPISAVRAGISISQKQSFCFAFHLRQKRVGSCQAAFGARSEKAESPHW